MSAKSPVLSALRLPAPYQELPGGMCALFAANALQSLGNFLWPMVSLILSERAGLTPDRVGFYVTMTLVGTAAGALAGGKLSDHLGHREVLAVFRVLTAAGASACAWLITGAMNGDLLSWLLVVTSLFRGATEPAALALAADLTAREQRPAAFSLLYLANRVGFLAPLAAGYLFRRHLVWLFLGYALTSLCSAVLVLAWVPRRRSWRINDHAESAPSTGRGLWSILRRQPFLLVLSSLLTTYSLVHVQHLFALPLQLQEWHGALGARLYGTLISLNSVVAVLLTAPLTALTRRLAPCTNLTLGGLLYAVGFGMLTFDHGLPWLVVSTLAWSLGEILVITNSLVVALDGTPTSHHGRVSSVLPLLSQGGYAVGPWLTGWLVASRGVSAVWPACLLVALAASGAIFSLRPSASR